MANAPGDIEPDVGHSLPALWIVTQLISRAGLSGGSRLDLRGLVSTDSTPIYWGANGVVWVMPVTPLRSHPVR